MTAPERGTSWEDRMSQRAQARMDAERQEQEARQRIEEAEYEARLFEEQRAGFEAGPPDGCRECYVWSDWYPLSPSTFSWWHKTMDEPPYECTHECHGGQPYPCATVAIG
jgi:hypothetical protein